MFAFFDLRGYLMMSVMITLGILVNHWKVIPELYKGTFYISLGLSLLASSIFYIIEGVQFAVIKEQQSTTEHT
jgi:Na+-transporting NADH:ubiquinone oxidoreductase subunit NqrD